MRKSSLGLWFLGVMALIAVAMIMMIGPTSKVQEWPQSYVFKTLEGAGAGNMAYFYIRTDEPVQKISLFQGKKKLVEVSDTDVLNYKVTSYLYLFDPHNYHVEVIDYKGNIFSSKPIKVKFSDSKEDFPPKFVETYFITDYRHDFNPSFVWLEGNVEIFFVISDIGDESGIKNVKLFQRVEDIRRVHWEEIKRETITISCAEKEDRTTEFFKFIIESPKEPGEYKFFAEAEDWGGNIRRSKIIKILWKEYLGFLF